jgi:hypothetical protein
LYLALRDLHIAILLDLDGINLALHLSFYMDAVHLSFFMEVLHLSFSMNLNFLLHLASTSLVQGIAKQMALLLYTKEWGYMRCEKEIKSCCMQILLHSHLNKN